jgi:hypothetical protein
MQTQKRAPTWPGVIWQDFRYIHRGGGTLDGRKTAERIRLALESGELPHRQERDIEVGIHMMLLCAGKAISHVVPLHIQYLTAHQVVQDFHAGLALATPEEAARVLAIIRASMVVGDALDGGARDD